MNTASLIQLAALATDSNRVRFRPGVIVLLTVLLACAGCAGSDQAAEESASTQAADREPTGIEEADDRVPSPTAAPVDIEPSDSMVTPAATPLPVEPEPDVDPTDRYRWTVSVFVELETDEPRIQLDELATVSVDRELDTALLELDLTGLPEAVLPQDRATVASVAYVDDVQIARGFDRATLGWTGDGEPDPDAWYEGRQSGEPGIPDILPPDATAGAFFEALNLETDSGGRASMSAPEENEVDLKADNLLAALARVDLRTGSDFTLKVETDKAGRVSEIVMELTPDDEGESDMLTISVEYGIDPFEVPERSSAEPVPGYVEEVPDPIEEAFSGASDVVIRLNLYLGRDLNVSLTAGNTIVRVGRTDIFAGPEDFVQWQLTRTGAERLVRAVLNNPVVASGAYNVYYRQGVGLDVGPPPGELNAHPDRERGAVDYSADIDALIDLLDDPTWLGVDIISGPEPWVPPTLTLTASPDESARDLARWPLENSIRELGYPGSGRNEGDLVVCLVGDQVPPVWELLGSGANYAHLGLDDGETWDGHVMMNWPGYRLFSDPCGPDFERFLEVMGEDG